MPNAPEPSPIVRGLLSMLHSAAGHPPIRFVLWNGASWPPSCGEGTPSVVIRDRRILWKLLLDPEFHFGEAYCRGKIEIPGSLLAVLEATHRRASGTAPGRRSRTFISRWLDWSQANSLRGSRRNIHRHYDIGTDFYKLWLDPQLVYTCAYFPNPDDPLEKAQVAKMDYVCRKVGLRPGEQVVEAGCGWGALALHMARSYSVKVKAFNISSDQIRHARRWAAEEGLNGQVEFIEDDYRNITGEYDAFISVGMLEHVGRQHYADLGAVIRRSLAASGRGFLHFIGRNRPQPLNSWIRSRIFPGAYPPTLRQVAAFLEQCDFSVLDVENLRLHYAKTLEHWLGRFETAAASVAAMFDEEFVRAWRLYLTGSIAAFRTGSLQLFQILFARDSVDRLPWTRAHLYADAPFAEEKDRWMPATR